MDEKKMIRINVNQIYERRVKIYDVIFITDEGEKREDVCSNAKIKALKQMLKANDPTIKRVIVMGFTPAIERLNYETHETEIKIVNRKNDVNEEE